MKYFWNDDKCFRNTKSIQNATYILLLVLNQLDVTKIPNFNVSLIAIKSKRLLTRAMTDLLRSYKEFPNESILLFRNLIKNIVGASWNLYINFTSLF